MKDNNVKRILQEDRRLVILRLLCATAGYSLNNFVLHSALNESGHSVSHALMETELFWLEEQGLLSKNQVSSDLYVLKATPRGIDVAKGCLIFPGVKQPEPGLDF